MAAKSYSISAADLNDYLKKNNVKEEQCFIKVNEFIFCKFCGNESTDGTLASFKKHLSQCGKLCKTFTRSQDINLRVRLGLDVVLSETEAFTFDQPTNVYYNEEKSEVVISNKSLPSNHLSTFTFLCAINTLIFHSTTFSKAVQLPKFTFSKEPQPSSSKGVVSTVLSAFKRDLSNEVLPNSAKSVRVEGKWPFTGVIRKLEEGIITTQESKNVQVYINSTRNNKNFYF